MIKTNKEKLFFQAARLILKDACPMNRDWYLCREEEDGEIEPRCIECWERYLWAIMNDEVK